MLTSLTAISPIDGRYQDKTRPLASLFSEYGLLYHRLVVEINYLKALAGTSQIKECPELSSDDRVFLDSIIDNFTQEQAETVKTIEKETNHDVKAVEYYIKQQVEKSEKLKSISEFIHFGLTSEDVNNLAYALMIKKACQDVIFPKMTDIIDGLTAFSKNHIALPILSRTHGQPASPSTLGKEIANVVARLKRAQTQLNQQVFLGKCNGAVGNYNALYTAYPEVDWPTFSKRFIEEQLGLDFNAYTTQIEPHDWIAELSQHISRFNTILIDFCRDTWSYISLGYFKQLTVANEVGSSTMPHKVNPIDFENAEGNLGLANALWQFFANKLPISRFQRDLTDSTVLRNIGIAFSHSLLAFASLLKGLSKLDVNKDLLQTELDAQWVLLAEPIQTVMRRYGIENPYEKLKALTRGQEITQQQLHDFIADLDLPEVEIQRLQALTPTSYLGLATELAKGL